MPEEPRRLAATIISAYISNNKVSIGEFKTFIDEMFPRLLAICSLQILSPVEEKPPTPVPRVPITKTIFPDYLISLENGKRFKTLAHHLNSLGMTPHQYRAKWGLPDDYPMVCANTHALRSATAKRNGLGLKKALRESEPEPTVAAPPPPPAPLPAPAPAPPKPFVDLAGAPQPDIGESPEPVRPPAPPPQSEIAAKVRAEAEAIPARKVSLDDPPRATRGRPRKAPVVVEVVKRRGGQPSAGAISSRKDAFRGSNGARDDRR